MVLFTGILFHGGWAQEDRQPVVAGQFYPAGPEKLSSELAGLFERSADRQLEDVIAIISPHAGYVFSGQVAASSFRQLDPDKAYDNVFVLASSHQMSFEGGSIYSEGDYLTPLGKVKVNKELAEELIRENDVFSGRKDAHQYEHSLEVQLPFLQYHLHGDFRIVPVIIGAQEYSTCEKLAAALKPFLNEKNLFVVSTDFSHYPDYDDARLIDKLTAEAILSNDPVKFIQTLRENKQKKIRGLSTSLCGWSSVLTLMYMTGDTDAGYHLIEYRNSGDVSPYGDKERVVGYCSIAVTASEKKSASSYLSEEEKVQLIDLARTTLETYVNSGKILDFNRGAEFPGRLQDTAGAFVTLKKEGKLRGCIGRFESDEPLWKVIQEMTIAAASEDYRFPDVKIDELDDIDIEISVLTPLRQIYGIDEIEIGRHGIYMKKGYHSGTLLPQVPVERKWCLEEFLGYCARDKARIGWDGWKDAELFVYESFIFGEKARKH